MNAIISVNLHSAKLIEEREPITSIKNILFMKSSYQL